MKMIPSLVLFLFLFVSGFADVCCMTIRSKHMHTASKVTTFGGSTVITSSSSVSSSPSASSSSSLSSLISATKRNEMDDNPFHVNPASVTATTTKHRGGVDAAPSTGGSVARKKPLALVASTMLASTIIFVGGMTAFALPPPAHAALTKQDIQTIVDALEPKFDAVDKKFDAMALGMKEAKLERQALANQIAETETQIKEAKNNLLYSPFLSNSVGAILATWSMVKATKVDEKLEALKEDLEKGLQGFENKVVPLSFFGFVAGALTFLLYSAWTLSAVAAANNSDLLGNAAGTIPTL